jgi:hypothetical protein
VLDGRDVGTVLFPDAPVKLYVTASDEVRAGRRHAELKAKGSNVTLEQVLQVGSTGHHGRAAGCKVQQSNVAKAKGLECCACKPGMIYT